MVEARYYKDLKHNYLIAKAGKTGENRRYEYRMIESNPIQGFIPVKLRSIDGEEYLYYEVSSRQSLENLYGDREMSGTAVARLLKAMSKAVTEADRYFLDERCIVFHPAYIYSSPGKEEFFFLYYPHSAEAEEKPLLPLAEFLIEHADHEDERAVSAVYKLYELVRDDCLVLPEMDDILNCPNDSRSGAEPPEAADPDKPCAYAGKTVSGRELSGEKSRDEEGLREKSPGGCSDYRKGEDVDAGDENFSEPDEDGDDRGEMRFYSAGRERKGGRSGGIIRYAAMMLVSLSVLGALWLLRLRYELDDKEEIVSLAVMAVCGGIALLCAAFLARQSWGRKDKEEKAPGGEDEIRYRSFSADEDSPGETEEKNDFPETIFVGCDMEGKKLYAVSPPVHQHIDLERLPWTVGKMPDCVDQVLRDASVSRVHARFSQGEDGIYMTDLNSTNGTFKNGLRLEPNESVLLEPGDEVRLGKLKYSYRACIDTYP